MLPWILKLKRTDQDREFAKIRERGSWSQNGGRQWNVPPVLPSTCGRPLVLFVLLTVVVGCASAQVAYERVSAAKLAKAEGVLREIAAEENWSDECLAMLVARLHRKYQN